MMGASRKEQCVVYSLILFLPKGPSEIIFFWISLARARSFRGHNPETRRKMPFLHAERSRTSGTREKMSPKSREDTRFPSLGHAGLLEDSRRA